MRETGMLIQLPPSSGILHAVTHKRAPKCTPSKHPESGTLAVGLVFPPRKSKAKHRWLGISGALYYCLHTYYLLDTWVPTLPT